MRRLRCAPDACRMHSGRAGPGGGGQSSPHAPQHSLLCSTVRHVCAPACLLVWPRWFNGLFLASALVTLVVLYGQYQAHRYDPLDALPIAVHPTATATGYGRWAGFGGGRSTQKRSGGSGR